MRRLAGLTFLLAFTTSTARADKLVLVAGGGDGGDGTEATKAKLIQPFGVDFWDTSDAGSVILIVEMVKGERLRVILPNGKLETLAGSEGVKGNAGDGDSAKKATFNGMHSLAVGPSGVYLADTWNNRVRIYHLSRVDAFAGTGEKGFSGDGGPAKEAKFGGIYCVSFDPDKKNLYITDLDNRRIRKVDMETKTVTTVAGNGQKGWRRGDEATAGRSACTRGG